MSDLAHLEYFLGMDYTHCFYLKKKLFATSTFCHQGRRKTAEQNRAKCFQNGAKAAQIGASGPNKDQDYAGHRPA